MNCEFCGEPGARKSHLAIVDGRRKWLSFCVAPALCAARFNEAAAAAALAKSRRPAPGIHDAKHTPG